MAEEVKEAVDGMVKAFEEFKATNESRLAELEKKDSADVLYDEKIAKIEADMDKFEDLNQKLTVQTQEQKGREVDNSKLCSSVQKLTLQPMTSTPKCRYSTSGSEK